MAHVKLQRGTIVKIKIRRVLIGTLLEMHQSACRSEHIPLSTFLGEIIEASAADFRNATAGSLPKKSRRNGKGAA
jgi:hypothetical protein